MTTWWSNLDRADRWLAVPSIVLLFIGGQVLVAGYRWGAAVVVIGCPPLFAWVIHTLRWSRQRQRDLEAITRELDGR